MSSLVLRWLTRLAEWWLDLDHQNLMTVAIGVAHGDDFAPFMIKQIPMLVKDGALYNRKPLKFEITNKYHVTAIARLTFEREWKITHRMDTHVMLGDVYDVKIKLTF